MGAEHRYVCVGAGLGPLKYLPRSVVTLKLLFGRRPAVVICMNPPFFAGLIAWLYCSVYRAGFVLDSHTAAFDQRAWVRLRALHRFLAARAEFSIVTNAELARRVEALGGRTLIISDVPLEIQHGDFQVEPGRFSICLSCSYTYDEPLLEVFSAVRTLPDVQLYVTGDTARATDVIRRACPPNTVLTGFLSNERYAGLLRSVSAIMALTTQDHTMQRGGSEAITVGKPFITSDWPILREIFPQGTVHVENRAESIRRGIEDLRRDYPRYCREMGEMSRIREERWVRARQRLEDAVDDLRARRSREIGMQL
jgi:glycosyltransferase involved in cell wall biosynthesis